MMAICALVSAGAPNFLINSLTLSVGIVLFSLSFLKPAIIPLHLVATKTAKVHPLIQKFFYSSVNFLEPITDCRFPDAKFTGNLYFALSFYKNLFKQLAVLIVSINVQVLQKTIKSKTITNCYGFLFFM